MAFPLFYEGNAMNTDMLVQLVFSGLTYGSIYAVVAIGFNIIYNSTGIINFAQGEFVMLGGMLAFTLKSFMPLGAAILLAVLFTAVIGSFLEFIFFRRLSNRKVKPNVLQMIVITIGISILIREIALWVWGEQVKTLPFFTGNETTSLALFGAHFSPQILWVLGITGLIVVALSLFFKYTLNGQAMRGCADTTDGASLCGIKPQSIVNLSFTLSAGIGALAGCIIAPITQIQYSMGSELAIKGFTVAVFGGIGNSIGALSAGLILGTLEAFAIVIFPEAYKNIITLVVLLAVLFFKPGGLFGSKKSRKVREV